MVAIASRVYEPANTSSSSHSQMVGLAGTELDHPYFEVVVIPPSHYMELDADGVHTPRGYDSVPEGNIFWGATPAAQIAWRLT